MRESLQGFCGRALSGYAIWVPIRLFLPVFLIVCMFKAAFDAGETYTGLSGE